MYKSRTNSYINGQFVNCRTFLLFQNGSRSHRQTKIDKFGQQCLLASLPIPNFGSITCMVGYHCSGLRNSALKQK